MVSCISFCRDDKVKIVWLMKAGEVRMAGVRGSRGGKMETTVFEQQYKNKNLFLHMQPGTNILLFRLNF